MNQYTTTQLQDEINRRNTITNTSIKLLHNGDKNEDALNIYSIRNCICFKVGSGLDYSICPSTINGKKLLIQLRDLCTAILNENSL
jgi:hypothetical protein